MIRRIREASTFVQALLLSVVLCIVGVIANVATVLAAGSSATIAETVGGPVTLIVWTWTSDDTTGSVTSAPSNATLDGEIIELATDPRTPAPTDDYDVAILDSNGLDVLAGAGANRDTANTEYKVDKNTLGAVSASKLTLQVTNAGNSTQGTVYLYIR